MKLFGERTKGQGGESGANLGWTCAGVLYSRSAVTAGDVGLVSVAAQSIVGATLEPLFVVYETFGEMAAWGEAVGSGVGLTASLVVEEAVSRAPEP